MVCPHCHREIPGVAVYCGACGRRVAGWRGETAADPVELPEEMDGRTRKVRPNSDLIRAAGGDPERTTELRPNSDLLAIVRGSPRSTKEQDPNSALIRASRREELDGEPDDAETVVHMKAAVKDEPRKAPVESTANSVSNVGSTRFHVEAALGHRRPRLALLMVANACLLVVGLYLIFSYVTRPADATGSEARPPAGKGYINWSDDGQSSPISDGPLEATFTSTGSSPAMKLTTKPSMKPTMNTKTVPGPGLKTSNDEPDRARRKRAFLRRVRERVRGRQEAIRRCYQSNAQRASKALRGFLDVRFAVGKSGGVTAANVVRNTTGSAGLGACIAGVMRGITFPAPPGGSVSLVYPFRFGPKR